MATTTRSAKTGTTTASASKKRTSVSTSTASASKKTAPAARSSTSQKHASTATPSAKTTAARSGKPIPEPQKNQTPEIPAVISAGTVEASGDINLQVTAISSLQGNDAEGLNTPLVTDAASTAQATEPSRPADAPVESNSPVSPTSELTFHLSSDPADLADQSEPSAESAHGDAPLLDDEIPEDADADPVDFDALRVHLTALQQKIRAAKIPVVIVFEGWGASGKGSVLSKLIEGLDPRGYQVYPVRNASEHDLLYPAMRRFWVHMPAGGNISLFCSSWYREVTKTYLESKPSRKRTNQRFQEIISMESQLITSGVLLIKFFLHISRKEQKRRLKLLESKKSTRWRVDKTDWLQNEHYEESLRLFDAMIARTHFDGAQWHVLRSDDRRSCVKQVYEIVLEAFQNALRDHDTGRRAWDVPYLPHLESTPVLSFPPLETIDPEQALTEPYKPAVDKAQKHLRKLQNELYRRGIPMVVGFEGWDAAGKGGTIRRLTSALDARGFDVVPIASPTPLESSHHYLWRFWREVPPNGHIAIFDRTWYGRVMVERVEGFCTESEWKRAYEEINRFESELAAHGVVLCKFWLQIDPDTQLVRFNDREASVDKQWKITDEDWRNRSKWPQYETAVNDMLQKTNTAYAPWAVIEANNKQYARLKVLHTVIQAIEARLAEDAE